MELYVRTYWQPLHNWFFAMPVRLLLLVLAVGLFQGVTHSFLLTQFSILFSTTWIFLELLAPDLQKFVPSILLKTNANSMPDAEKPAGEAAAVTTLAINDNNKTEILRFQEIVWLQSEYNGVIIQTTHKKYVAIKSLRSIEKVLDAQQFVRIRRSAIVNRHFIQAIHNLPSGDGYVELTTGEEIRYSRNYKKALMN